MFNSLFIMQKLKKIVVFDVDGTLLHRTFDQIKGKHHFGKVNNRFIYFRPYLNVLSDFIIEHEK